MKKKSCVNPEDVTEDSVFVRGRLKTDTKSDTFNQLWTSEEQRRLEQLLLEFPPERVESRRFKKIADKLATKSLSQVVFLNKIASMLNVLVFSEYLEMILVSVSPVFIFQLLLDFDHPLLFRVVASI